ncbi:putative oxidase [Grosmannia clavigera kw1407]|uniref:Putative oxidase n=1 Tax=Grosmannia clavigera (strain kw1407 / UAMH 11150) TaxID=655863 RepID=F0X6W8_GROCL|nr:putative oxidase [Grosmannia clavigera kw1407]EFX06375.1 putative oxidase [Grosmannia clavigera kw1407]
MHLSAALLGLLYAGSPAVQAFPDLFSGRSSDRSQGPALDDASPLPCKWSITATAAVRRTKKKRLLFDPLTTPIEVTGEHVFIAPDFAAGDQRGPCPGLNALANHGYIGRNGVTSLLEATAAINEVWGMGIDLGGVLALLGTVFVGNPLSLDPGFSIGNTSSAVHNLLGDLDGLLGTPRGLDGSHNIIEGDSSATRADLYVTGDASTLVLQQFRGLYDRSTGEGDYNMDVLGAHADARFTETVASNPQFYYGPFTGMIARNAGYIFSARMFANHSAANPTGLLNKKTLMSIYGVEMINGTMVYNKGHERIPENWYRRPVDYGLVELNLDIVALILKYPQLASIGGNVGTVNSFAGVDLGDLTGGVLNAAKLLEGNNLLCFVFEVVKTLAPNSLSSLFATIEAPLQLLLDTLDTALLNISCPAFKDLTIGGTPFQDALTNLYPGTNVTGSVL